MESGLAPAATKRVCLPRNYCAGTPTTPNQAVERGDHLCNETGIGGFKEVIALVKGKGAYSRLNTNLAFTAFSASHPQNPPAGFTPPPLPWP